MTCKFGCPTALELMIASANPSGGYSVCYEVAHGGESETFAARADTQAEAEQTALEEARYWLATRAHPSNVRPIRKL